MKRTLVALVAAAAITGLVSCSNSADTDAAPGSSADEDAASLPGEDVLAEGLLTIDDVPAGWAEVPQDDDDDDPLCGIRLTELLGLDEDSLPSATVLYAEDSNTGPGFGETVGFVPAGRGTEVLPAFRDAIDACDGDTLGGLDATVSALSFPSVGDDSAAYRITLTDPESEQSTDIDAVYAVAGDLATVFYAFDLRGDPTETLTIFVPKAFDRAVQTLGPTPSG
jgi:hypothetical protein